MWRNIPSYLKSSLELCSLLKNLSTFSKRKVKWLFHLVEPYLFVDKVLKRPKKKKKYKILQGFVKPPLEPGLQNFSTSF